MVCSRDGIICIPKYAIKENTAHCFSADIKCNGRQECADNSDEESCSTVLQTDGVVALIAIACILVLIGVPIVIIIIRIKKGKVWYPACMEGCVRKFRKTENQESSTARLHHSPGAADESTNKQGFTNVSFDTPHYAYTNGDTENGYRQQQSRFHKSLDSDERMPSIRDWQTNRLGGNSPGKADGTRSKRDGAYNSGTSSTQPTLQVRYQAGYSSNKTDNGNPPPYRQYQQKTPDKPQSTAYTITQNSGLPSRSSAPWERPSQSSVQRSQNYSMEPTHNGGYEHYTQSKQNTRSGGVSPGQLKTALEHAAYGSADQTAHTDTVV